MNKSSAYRDQAEVPTYAPTPSEKIINEAKEAQAKKAKKKRDMFGLMGITAFPCATISLLGVEWYNISTAFAVTSIFAIVIASVGAGLMTGNLLDW